MSGGPTIKIKVQIYCGDQIAMGPGKADLLDAIALEGSISAAGRKLHMSYRRCWLLVDVMNRCWTGPLVSTNSAGARLTELGVDILRHYRALQGSVGDAATGGKAMLTAVLREAPLPVQSEAAHSI
ncbi:ModE family transcriptional regulator [Sphingobium sp. AN558]|uniref:winged helix-turn-helix domain-containing protein n=1 Tax=Sphingobium sp. AN558 TaxID=3133442 RepID=UPI0030C3847B